MQEADLEEGEGVLSLTSLASHMHRKESLVKCKRTFFLPCHNYLPIYYSKKHVRLMSGITFSFNSITHTYSKLKLKDGV